MKMQVFAENLPQLTHEAISAILKTEVMLLKLCVVESSHQIGPDSSLLLFFSLTIMTENEMCVFSCSRSSYFPESFSSVQCEMTFWD